MRPHRRMWGLTQKELARLVGVRSPTHVSRIEHNKRVPRVEIVFACEVLFGVPAREMFPQLYEHVEESVLQSARVLHKELAEDESLVAYRKRELLSLARERAVDKSNQKEAV